MIKRKSRIKAYSLLEMLLVMAILVVFGAFGAGGFLGFRETTLVKENVEVLKQDILLAQQKSMLLEKDIDDNWLYGIGLDFSNISEGSYEMFRWCSPFTEFGNSVTRSKILGWDPSQNIGDTVTEVGVLGVSDVYAQNYIDPTLPVLDDDDSSCTYIPYPNKCPRGRFAPACCIVYCPAGMCCNPRYTSTYCTAQSTYCLCGTDPCCTCVESCPQTEIPNQEDEEDEEDVEGALAPFINGFLPVGEDTPYTSQCTPGATSLVKITGQAADRFVDIGDIQLLGDPSVQIKYLVFEAVTGKAFLYGNGGYVANYLPDGTPLNPEDMQILDIAITRTRSSKFDLLSIYPGSGTIVHHVYTDKDLYKTGDTGDTITVNGKTYSRFGVFDDISSYREYDD
ncbi:MAG: hypothetical protein RBS01_01350 [Candidatus Dojkabacteria bacterium]|jgi:type II secretory pathway pseudopilin PulG|nr:hypothetical protein [Candidatus Dojkabacteria bacterium]